MSDTVLIAIVGGLPALVTGIAGLIITLMTRKDAVRKGTITLLQTENKRYVLLLPRGANLDAGRRWPEEKYIDLARRIARNGVTPVVLGGTEERQVGAAMAKEVPSIKNLVTRPDLFQCIGLAERASFAVGDDVELMHVSAAAGASCLVFLSSLHRPDLAAPKGRGGVVEFTATVIADLPVDQVERQLRNCGVFREAATA